jgi:hypothetical protein
LEAVRWQFGAGRPPQRRFADIGELAAPGADLRGRLRARLTVANRGPKEIEGILLRYCLSARISPAAGQAGVWSVPFLIEQKRVPRLGPHQSLETSLDSTELVRLYLKRVARNGFSPTELKLYVMVEPQRGQTAPIQTVESTLPLRP